MTGASGSRRWWLRVIGGVGIVGVAGAALLGATRSNGQTASTSPYFLLRDETGQMTLTALDTIQQPTGRFEIDLALGDVALVDITARPFIIEHGGDNPVFDQNAPTSSRVVTVHDQPASLGVSSQGTPLSLEWLLDNTRYSIAVTSLSTSRQPTEQQIIDIANTVTPTAGGSKFTISTLPSTTTVLFTGTKNSTATTYQLLYSDAHGPASLEVTVATGIDDSPAGASAAPNAESVSSGGKQRWIEKASSPAGAGTAKPNWIVTWSPAAGTSIHLVANAMTRAEALNAADEVTPATIDEWTAATTNGPSTVPAATSTTG